MDMLYLPHTRSAVHGSVTMLPPHSIEGSNLSINQLVSESKTPSKGSSAGKNRYSARQSTATSISAKETGVLKRFMGFPKEQGKEKVEEQDVGLEGSISLAVVDEPVGCLAFHIKHCKDFANTLVLKKRMQLTIRITVGRTMKCTTPHHIKELLKMKKSKITIPFEEVKYFIAQIPKQKNDERNKIAVELVGVERFSDAQRLLGQTYLHLIDIIKKGSVSETCELGIKNLRVCNLDMSIDFSYGHFGYGYSNQLRQVEKDKSGINENSLFLRIPPLENRKDEVNNVITYQTMPYPMFLPEELQVSVGGLGRERERETVAAESSEYFTKVPRRVLQLMKTRKRLDLLRNEYDKKKTQEQRIEFLEQLILKRTGKSGKILRSERRDKASSWVGSEDRSTLSHFTDPSLMLLSSGEYSAEIEQGEGYSRSWDEPQSADQSLDLNIPKSVQIKIPSDSTISSNSSVDEKNAKESQQQPSNPLIASIVALHRPFLKFMKMVQTFRKSITPSDLGGTPVAQSAVNLLIPELWNRQSLLGEDSKIKESSYRRGRSTLHSPEITIQEDKQDGMMIEKGIINQIDSTFIPMSTPTTFPVLDKTLGTKENATIIDFHDEIFKRVPIQLHLPFPTLKSIVDQEIKNKHSQNKAMMNLDESMEIIGGLLTTSLAETVSESKKNSTNEIPDERLPQAMSEEEYDISPTTKSKQDVPSRKSSVIDTEGSSDQQISISSPISVVYPSTIESSSSKEDSTISLTERLIKSTQHFTGSINIEDTSSFTAVLEASSKVITVFVKRGIPSHTRGGSYS
ncbi:uncharacterized protein LOC129698924 [Leucoraja erinacea]|uniref:uncharacterized protein LOC129698924 n=1 Tax=Leucoraja erinaceus TaxID=7782 RepID=UPI0024554D28|nr:uncharacterized protein LOC129698924 [Leucoraja erinacea]